MQFSVLDPNNNQNSCTKNARQQAGRQHTDRHTQRQTGMCIVVFGGADLTSTSYVYSSLVVHAPGRVAARAPVHPSVLHLGVGHVELADHVALVGLVVAQVVVAVFDDGVVVQGPAAAGEVACPWRCRPGRRARSGSPPSRWRRTGSWECHLWWGTRWDTVRDRNTVVKETMVKLWPHVNDNYQPEEHWGSLRLVGSSKIPVFILSQFLNTRISFLERWCVIIDHLLS